MSEDESFENFDDELSDHLSRKTNRSKRIKDSKKNRIHPKISKERDANNSYRKIKFNKLTRRRDKLHRADKTGRLYKGSNFESDFNDREE